MRAGRQPAETPCGASPGADLPGLMMAGERRERKSSMKAKNILNIWTGWDSPDIFKVHVSAPDGSLVTCFETSGVELMTSPFVERELKLFGSYGKGEDGIYRHHIEVAAG